MIKWRRGWFPLWYGFCPTEADFRKALRRSTDPWAPWPTAPGCCVTYDDDVGDRRALVTVNVDWDEHPHLAMGVLVHECVHVVQWVVSTMADRSPSEEFVAYATQAVFSELLHDIAEWRKKFPNGALPQK